MVNLKKYEQIITELDAYKATLVAISKTKPVDDIKLLLNNGQKAFGENYVNELVEKNKIIPNAEWHFVGHLQSNKIKFLASFTALIHGIDSLQLLKKINTHAIRLNFIQNCLLQIHIAKEETKFGFSFDEVDLLLNSGELNQLKNISIKGFMGMATATENKNLIQNEFTALGNFFQKNKNTDLQILSMGMTSDYKIALNEGSTLVRIGSAIFGERK